MLAGEVVDGTFMDVAALRRFLTEQIARAKADDVLFSVHLKATMMKVSDPILFGHAVQAFFPTLFEQYGEVLKAAGDLAQRRSRRAALGRRLAARGRRDRRRGHAGPGRRPRDGDGRLRQGHHQPARPLRRDHRRLDAGDDPPVRPHVGPGRRGGRHARGHPGLVVRRRLPDRARRLPRPRRLRPVHHGLGAQRRPDGQGGRGVRLARQDLRGARRRHRAGRERRRATCCISHAVQPGDVWRACQTKDESIRDWVKLAVTRARASGSPAIFWLDETRAHDAQPDRQGQRVPRRSTTPTG